MNLLIGFVEKRVFLLRIWRIEEAKDTVVDLMDDRCDVSKDV